MQQPHNDPNDMREPKQMGVFGAPACRCTTTLIALCVALIGLVLAGIGACMAGFMPHEELPKYVGIALLVIGLLMIFGGVGLFAFDQVTLTRQQRDRPTYAPGSGYERADESQIRPPARVEAPPSYDSVVQEESRRPASAAVPVPVGAQPSSTPRSQTHSQPTVQSGPTVRPVTRPTVVQQPPLPQGQQQRPPAATGAPPQGPRQIHTQGPPPNRFGRGGNISTTAV